MYAYVMCPKCKDHFLETDKYNFFDERRCPKCGNRYVLALLGEMPIDDTIYKITFDGRPFLDNKVIKYLEEKLEEYHFDVDDMMQKIKNWEEGNVIYEGDSLHTYLLMDILGIHELCYIVTPEFSYKRSMAPHIALCPDCGSETVEKEEKTDDMKGCFNKGRFCKHCNKWTVCFLVNET